MVKIELYPPLSFRFTSKKVGTFVLDIEINRGETLSDLLLRLTRENREAWENLFNIKTGRMKGPVRTVVNGTALPSSALEETKLSDNDHIVFMIIIGGG